MKTVSEIILEHVEATKKKFYAERGKPENEKKEFINWYVENHKAPISVILHDLSNYYLHLTEIRILDYMNEQE